MLLQWNGHSEFLLESADGFRVLTDPFDDHVGYPMRDVRADAVTVSHEHGDHSYTAKVKGKPAILSEAGATRLTPQVKVSAVNAFHDDARGTKRGMTLLTVIEMDGLRIAHLGDIGTLLDADQQAFLRDIDILLIPVGGFYTIDATQAADIVRAIQPKVTVPMHYKTSYNSGWPISDVDPFWTALGVPAQVPVPLLRVTREDIGCCRPFCVFEEPKA